MLRFINNDRALFFSSPEVETIWGSWDSLENDSAATNDDTRHKNPAPKDQRRGPHFYPLPAKTTNTHYKLPV